jgi:hypothetical protein
MTKIKKITFLGDMNFSGSSGSTFNTCPLLEEITTSTDVLPGSSLSSGVFSGDYRLTKIPSIVNVTSFGNSCFANCASLDFENITFSDNIAVVNSNTFNNCKLLKRFTYSEAASSVATQTFQSSGLEELTLLRTSSIMTLLSTNAFSGTTLKLKIYVPDALVNDYKVATNWVTYANQIFPLSSKP